MAGWTEENFKKHIIKIWEDIVSMKQKWNTVGKECSRNGKKWGGRVNINEQ